MHLWAPSLAYLTPNNLTQESSSSWGLKSPLQLIFYDTAAKQPVLPKFNKFSSLRCSLLVTECTAEMKSDTANYVCPLFLYLSLQDSWPASTIGMIRLKTPGTLWSSLKPHPMPLLLSYGQASTSVSQLSLFELFLLEELLNIKLTREQNAEHSTAAKTFICNTGQPGSLL